MLRRRGRRGGRSCFRRTPDAVALELAALEYRQHFVANRHAIRAGRGLRRRRPPLDPDSDAVTLVTTGDGATSEGEFWESLNVACLERLPRRLSGRRQRLRDFGSGGKADRRRRSSRSWSAAFPNLKVFECDGTDFIASYATMTEAGRMVPRASDSGAGPRHLHPSLFALAFATTKSSTRPRPSAMTKRAATHRPLIPSGCRGRHSRPSRRRTAHA